MPRRTSLNPLASFRSGAENRRQCPPGGVGNLASDRGDPRGNALVSQGSNILTHRQPFRRAFSRGHWRELAFCKPINHRRYSDCFFQVGGRQRSSPPTASRDLDEARLASDRRAVGAGRWSGQGHPLSKEVAHFPGDGRTSPMPRGCFLDGAGATAVEVSDGGCMAREIEGSEQGPDRSHEHRETSP